MKSQDEILGELLQVADHTFQRDTLTHLRDLTYLSLAFSAFSLVTCFALLVQHH